jgi:uncharacterized RDD family membrane protein YckC
VLSVPPDARRRAGRPTAAGAFIFAMERGSTPDRPGGDEPSSPLQPPATPTGPQAPPGPQPAPAATPPEQAPPRPQAPTGPEVPPGYGGPVPPGGWHQPVAPQPQLWTGAPLSGWWRRVGAYILDGIFTSILIWLGSVLIVAGSEAAGVILMLVGLAVAFFYYPITMAREGAANGQTLGKQILSIRVVRDDGEPVTFGFALLREFVVKYLLFQVIGGVLLGIPWLLDVLWPLWDNQNRALHDMMVKSHVLEA